MKHKNVQHWGYSVFIIHWTEKSPLNLLKMIFENDWTILCKEFSRNLWENFNWFSHAVKIHEKIIQLFPHAQKLVSNYFSNRFLLLLGSQLMVSW